MTITEQTIGHNLVHMKWKCSKCGRLLDQSMFHEVRYLDRKRPVMSQCKACRARKRHPSPCAICGKHKKLCSNSICKKCNLEGGLKQCGGCGMLCLVGYNISATKTLCYDCIRIARKLPGGMRRLKELAAEQEQRQVLEAEPEQARKDEPVPPSP